MTIENRDEYTGQSKQPLISLPIKEFPPKHLQSFTVSIVIQAEIRPSEDPILVLKAVKTLFPDGDFTIENNAITGRFIDLKVLNYFVERIYQQQTFDSVRKAVSNGMIVNRRRPQQMITTEFYINKQVALNNRIVMCDPGESPLGPITIRIISDNLPLIIDLYFPKWEWFFENPNRKEKKMHIE